uniref:glucuronosyltransferase n=1 Tax=Meloidogyne enterolobii TaxID=390850 RepID=A0A6V7WAS4_MELEN|nr:unnamed protein product [Meloidogyne enterolobii]
MGESVSFNGFTQEYFNELVETFLKYDKCKFVVQLKDAFHSLVMLLKNFSAPWRLEGPSYNNIYFYMNKVNLQKFLAHKNLRGFITAGDQKCFNQALYRGVPLILIPFTFEEKFNAKIAEYMKVGLLLIIQNLFKNFLLLLMN